MHAAEHRQIYRFASNPNQLLHGRVAGVGERQIGRIGSPDGERTGVQSVPSGDIVLADIATTPQGFEQAKDRAAVQSGLTRDFAEPRVLVSAQLFQNHQASFERTDGGSLRWRLSARATPFGFRGGHARDFGKTPIFVN